jgi:hypothetical protein
MAATSASDTARLLIVTAWPVAAWRRARGKLSRHHRDLVIAGSPAETAWFVQFFATDVRELSSRRIGRFASYDALRAPLAVRLCTTSVTTDPDTPDARRPQPSGEAAAFALNVWIGPVQLGRRAALLRRRTRSRHRHRARRLHSDVRSVHRDRRLAGDV